jgi:nitrite reductase/ring-hydroxylating ferredoxin subunit
LGSEESGTSAGSNPGGALCRVADIPDGGAIGVHVPSSTGGFDLILLRVGDRVFAYHNECPHAGRNLDYAPGQFLVTDARIVCAVHGATFAVESGACLGGPCRSGLVGMPVEVVGGEVWVR